MYGFTSFYRTQKSQVTGGGARKRLSPGFAPDRTNEDFVVTGTVTRKHLETFYTTQNPGTLSLEELGGHRNTWTHLMPSKTRKLCNYFYKGAFK